MGYSIFLIKDLEIRIIFKDKTKEEGVGVTNFINWIIQVLREDLERLVVSTQDTGLMEPVKL